ncbi:MAG: hypothetical protein JWM68_2424 [Verrucomicrobiales bacterium]|nr:hypothetical protein [Verrucomicrobiales bacterium]
MPEAWRIVKEKHAATAFSGEGAARTGGRWNSRGIPVVYASSTQSLAALESLVHLNPPVLFKYVAFRLKFEESLVEIAPIKTLPADWQTQPPPPSTKTFGDLWLREMRSVLLQLPSVIIPAEANYLINPTHRDFKKLFISKPSLFAFDPRLLA